MACIALVLLRQTMQLGSPIETARLLASHFDGKMGATILEKHLKTMIERGHIYMYLERELGRGICFTLGVDFPETSWTGLLTKGTNGPDPIMATLRKSSATTLAGRYSTLRDALVAYKMAEISRTPVAVGGPMGLDHIYLAPIADANRALEDYRFGQN